MDSFNFCDVKLEKANAMKRHRQFQRIANLFRLIEICLLVALVSRFSIQLPVAVKNSSGYFKDILASPFFIFVLGNVIVIILFARSGQFSGQDCSGKGSKIDLYQEFVERSQGVHRYEATCTEKNITSVKYMVSEDAASSAVLQRKNYQRSQSQKFERPNCKGPFPELRRSMTDPCQEAVESIEELEEDSCPEDNLSNEEFRWAVEAFIARQKKLLMIDE